MRILFIYYKSLITVISINSSGRSLISFILKPGGFPHEKINFFQDFSWKKETNIYSETNKNLKLKEKNKTNIWYIIK